MPNLYFIGYALSDTERPPVDALRQRIADAFGVSAALKIVPHMTVVRPFHADDVGALSKGLKELATKHAPIPSKFTGFGAFEEAVWYLAPEQLSALNDLKRDAVALTERATGGGEISTYAYTTFHVTLAFKDVTPETHRKIGEMLQSEPLPLNSMTVNALSLFKHRGHDQGFEVIDTFPFAGA